MYASATNETNVRKRYEVEIGLLTKSQLINLDMVKTKVLKSNRGKRETVDDDFWRPESPVEVKVDLGFKVSYAKL